MATGADLYPDFLLGGAGGECVAAGTGDDAFLVLRVNAFLHLCYLLDDAVIIPKDRGQSKEGSSGPDRECYAERCVAILRPSR